MAPEYPQNSISYAQLAALVQQYQNQYMLGAGSQYGYLPPELMKALYGITGTGATIGQQELSGYLTDPRTGQLNRDDPTLGGRQQLTREDQQRLQNTLGRSELTGNYWDTTTGQYQQPTWQNMTLPGRQQFLSEAQTLGRLINPITGEQTMTPTQAALQAQQSQTGYVIDPVTGQVTQNQTLAGELGRGNLSLAQRAQYLAEQDRAANPRNYAASLFTQRGQSQGDPYNPPFLQALRGEVGPVTPAALAAQRVGPEPYTNDNMRYGRPVGVPQQRFNLPQYGSGLNARAFQNMNPTEGQAFDSMVSANGIDPETYRDQLRRSLPQTRLNSIVGRFTG